MSMSTQQATAGDNAFIIQICGSPHDKPQLHLDAPPFQTPPHSGSAQSETTLLLPGAIATSFVGHERLIRSFVDWANAPAPMGPVSVRVVHGGAGVGKTRFAMELCRELGQAPDSSWQAGFVDATEAQRFFHQTNIADWGWQAPTLVVFDDALTLLDLLSKWMKALCAIPNNRPPLRIVLLERQADSQGGWLEKVFSSGLDIYPVQPRDLLDGEPYLLPGMLATRHF